MFKKILAIVLLAWGTSNLLTPAMADAETAAIGYYSTSCGSAPPPCFIQYGPTVPISGTITASNPSVGTNAATGPTSSTQIGGQDGSGNLQPVKIGPGTEAGAVRVTLPTDGTGVVTAKQGTPNSVANGWPMINGEPADTTGTFTNGTQSTAITTPSVDGYETATITLNGTYNTATGTFQASDDGGVTYYTLRCARTDSVAVEAGYTSLTNINRAWFCPIHSFDTIRVQSSAVTSGTVNVRISISASNTSSGVTTSISGDSTIGVEGVDGQTQASASNPFPVSTVGSTFAPSQISLSTSAAQVLAALANPSAREVCNIDTAIIEYVGATGVTSTTGLPIYPGTCWDASHSSAAVFAVAASATPKVAVVQY